MTEKVVTGNSNIIPWPMMRNFLTQIGPLMVIVGKNSNFIFENMPAYKARLRKHRKPWAHIKNESEFDSRKSLTEEDYKDLPDIKNDTYLRPTRLCECDTPEIRAIAKKLGAGKLSDAEYAKAAYNWVMTEKKLVFKPIGGALETFRTKGGTCLDQLNLLAAIARAGGVPARYRLYGLAPDQQLYDLWLEPNPILRETYDTLGFLEAMHGEAELYINGKWVPGDPTFSPDLNAGMGLPITPFGEEPGWRIRVKGKGDIRFESFPAGFKHLMIPVLFLVQKSIDQINDTMDELREKGKKLIDEIGIEEYNRKNKKQFKPSIPSVTEVQEFRKKMKEEKNVVTSITQSEKN
jgi:hypothetical protein